MHVPPEDAGELELLLFEQSGTITWAQATALLSPGKVRQLIATGRWRRLCRGVFVTADGQQDAGQELWAAVLAAGPGAVLAGLAAARAGGLRRIPKQRRDGIDVYVPASRRAANLLRRLPAEFPAAFVHRTRYLPAQDLQRGRPTRTTMERALVDAAQWAITDGDAQGILAAGCQQRLALPADLLAVVDRMPNLTRRRLIRTTLNDLAGGLPGQAPAGRGGGADPPRTGGGRLAITGRSRTPARYVTPAGPERWRVTAGRR